MTHVAVDLLGGDGAPGSVVDGVRRALAADPTLDVSLVGPSRLVESLVRAHGLDGGGRLRIVEASHAVGPDADAVRAVRSRRDATVRVAARLIRDGAVDAMVSAGPVAAAVAAAAFTLGPLPGATKPALAVVVDASSGPVLLLDAGAVTDASISADQLTQCAVIGSVYATICLQVARPRIGLLSADPGQPAPPAHPDRSRGGTGVLVNAGELITEVGLDFVGGVGAATVVAGGDADVVVSDGFTGAVLVSGLRAVAQAVGQLPPVGQLPRASRGWHLREGEFVVGVDGIVVVVDGRSGETAAGVALAIADASAADRAGWVCHQRAALAGLVTRRRVRAGLSA